MIAINGIRSLRGVKLVISDAHEGLKAAIATVLHATRQRCRVYMTLNLLAHAGRQGRIVVAAFVGTAFAHDDAASARSQWRQVADHLRPKAAKLATTMDEMEEQNDEWTVQRGRYMTLETIAGLCDQSIIKPPAAAAA